MLNEPSRTDLEISNKEPANNDYTDTGRDYQSMYRNDELPYNPRIDYKNMKILDKR